MVMKICKVCGKEFDARGRAKCCSPECSKIRKSNYDKKWRENNPDYWKPWHENNPDYFKEYYKNNRDKIHEQQKKYKENHCDEIIEYKKEYYENNHDKIREQQKKWRVNNPNYGEEYRENHRDELFEKELLRQKKIISDFNKQYNGNLEKILENIPSRWQVREAKMRVFFDESYCDAMIVKIKSTPLCEVTGVSHDLVIHHLYSFNTHPELGNDIANMIRITKTVHDDFHNIYGYGNNTPEQWMDFVENYNRR